VNGVILDREAVRGSISESLRVRISSELGPQTALRLSRVTQLED